MKRFGFLILDQLVCSSFAMFMQENVAAITMEGLRPGGLFIETCSLTTAVHKTLDVFLMIVDKPYSIHETKKRNCMKIRSCSPTMVGVICVKCVPVR